MLNYIGRWLQIYYHLSTGHNKFAIRIYYNIKGSTRKTINGPSLKHQTLYLRNTYTLRPYVYVFRHPQSGQTVARRRWLAT